jgi:hypothetical protein
MVYIDWFRVQALGHMVNLSPTSNSSRLQSRFRDFLKILCVSHPSPVKVDSDQATPATMLETQKPCAAVKKVPCILKQVERNQVGAK